MLIDSALRHVTNISGIAARPGARNSLSSTGTRAVPVIRTMAASGAAVAARIVVRTVRQQLAGVIGLLKEGIRTAAFALSCQSGIGQRSQAEFLRLNTLLAEPSNGLHASKQIRTSWFAT